MSSEKNLKSFILQGKAAFSLHVGIVSHVEGEQYNVFAIDSDYEGIHQGDIFELENTYCRDVISQGKTMTYDDVAVISEMLKHPCYVNTQLRAYIGTPLFINGQVWGTLNFSSQKPQQPIFSSQDYKLVESMARQIERIIENDLNSTTDVA